MKILRLRLLHILTIAAAFTLAACDQKTDSPPVPKPSTPSTKPTAENATVPAKKLQTLAEAKTGFKTTLTRQEKEDYPAPAPPPELFDLIQYPGPLGKMDAYVTVDPDNGEKNSAIIWLVGGFGNSISETPWEPAERDNDQSAATFRKAGIVTMYPSLRGGNQNPGHKEGLLGEVDDVIAAAKHLATLDYVDPNRIYLGGHSVGGTLALLVAESTDLFRATFALGPVAHTADYGEESVPFDVTDKQEARIRAPVEWLPSIQTPTFAFEGSGGNLNDTWKLVKKNRSWSVNSNPLFHGFILKGHDHFSIIRPLSELLAAEILKDTSETCEIDFTPAGIEKWMEINEKHHQEAMKGEADQ